MLWPVFSIYERSVYFETEQAREARHWEYFYNPNPKQQL